MCRMFLCLFVWVLQSQAAFSQPYPPNLLAGQGSDSLANFVKDFVETDDHYIFSLNYGKRLSGGGQRPYVVSGFLLIDKQTGIASTRHISVFHEDSTREIIKMVLIGDTIHTIESVIYGIPDTVYVPVPHMIYSYWYFHKRYTLDMELVRSVFFEGKGKNGCTLCSLHPMVQFNDEVFSLVYATYPTPNPFQNVLKYSVYDLGTDEPVQQHLEINPQRELYTYEEEMSSYTSLDDADNILVPAYLNRRIPAGWMSEMAVLRLNRSHNYAVDFISFPYQMQEDGYIIYFDANTYPYLVQHQGSYYYNQQVNTAYYSNPNGLSDSSFNRTVIFKGVQGDTGIIPVSHYISRHAPAYGYPEHDVHHVIADKDALLFIDDTLVMQIQISRANTRRSSLLCYKTGNARPSNVSDIQVTILDTGLRERRVFYLFDTTRTKVISGFRQTASGAVMVYGSSCPHNERYDSISMFAFLIDPYSGFPLNIYNAESFVQPGVWEIYPNPSHGQFRVSGYRTDGYAVEVMDMHGRRVRSVLLRGAETAVSTEGLVPGMYLCRIVETASGRTVHISRLLVQ